VLLCASKIDLNKSHQVIQLYSCVLVSPKIKQDQTILHILQIIGTSPILVYNIKSTRILKHLSKLCRFLNM